MDASVKKMAKTAAKDCKFPLEFLEKESFYNFLALFANQVLINRRPPTAVGSLNYLGFFEQFNSALVVDTPLFSAPVSRGFPPEFASAARKLLIAEGLSDSKANNVLGALLTTLVSATPDNSSTDSQLWYVEHLRDGRNETEYELVERCLFTSEAEALAYKKKFGGFAQIIHILPVSLKA